ncbi:hypothetical protein LCGC14_0973540 [marine sediment metagenome]|uniref:TIGR03790 family protein n=1 Tax=marine sediment metagenome TaxID=412755 RepID=A0A0F9NX19_9ZZZZ|nr:TIGR03790 family protein [Methylophaga sp.]
MLQLLKPSVIILLVSSLLISGITQAASSTLTGENVLVLYKKTDALSKKIAEYYAKKRHVPASQVMAVDIIDKSKVINRQKFASLEKQVSKHLTKNIKVLLLAWNVPYRVECMSITSAFTLGFDEKYCSHTPKLSKGCHPTALSPYFNASPEMLWQRDDLRLSMMLSGRTFEDAKQLIDRGVAADNSQPSGDGYLVRTRDNERSTRWPDFKNIAELWPKKKGLTLHYVDDRADLNDTVIKDKQDILFYMTGYPKVPAIDTNHYLPGAIADHLTSSGGAGIDNTRQMSIYRWLEAGATASYGAVIEPCNFTEKFPDAQILIPNYLSGQSLIEAYWKSVQQPGEGIFVGEPLACPWCK